MLPTTRGEPPFRVLLVDRSEQTRDLFAALLVGLGYDVRSVATALAALTLVPLFRPRAVVTSIFLPDRTGFELCRALRSMPETADARIVAITGHITHDSIALAKEAGFDHYLVKPVSFETILAAIQPPYISLTQPPL